MAFRLRRFREISKVLPQYFHSGLSCQHYRQHIISPTAPFMLHLPHICFGTNESILNRVCHVHRFATVSEATQVSPSEADLLIFLESTLDELEGPFHRWFNKCEGKTEFDRDGVFLVLAGAFLEDSLLLDTDRAIMFERVKLLQQRYKELHIFGFQSCSSICSSTTQARLFQTITKEYITFPILSSSKNLTEMTMTSGECYLLFKGFRSPLFYHEKSTDFGIISKAIEELLLKNEDTAIVQNFQSTLMKPSGVIKEPKFCYSMQNLLLYFPGCISVDEDGNRLFLSDINHHRIIIFDADGKILDCIGSSPGFEDGEFEDAKLLRPAASFYMDTEDCLYFVDSENHSVRRADLVSRIVETVYPKCGTDKKISSIWSWILYKLGIAEVAQKSEEFDMEPLSFPWHLMGSGSDFLIINRSFETLWLMDLTSGKIKEVVKGFPNILEIYGEMIMERRSSLKQILHSCLQQKIDHNCSLDGLQYCSLISSLATFQNSIVFCDTVGQRVLKLDRGSGIISNLQFSGFGVLGLPYWLSCPLEHVFVRAGANEGAKVDHFQCFSVLPGKCDIAVNVNIPEDSMLAEPLQEGCIWRQARGSAAEISGSDSVAISSEKVGVAQQWFDELDNLAFSTPGSELSVHDENRTQDTNFEEATTVHIDSTVNLSPGTSEVIIYAVLYLKLNRTWNTDEVPQEKKAARIVDILNTDKSGKQEKETCTQLLLEAKRDLGEVVFIKPLHLRIRLECGDNPRTDTTKETVLTDSSIEVNVSLN
ncbi:uncharacterized protein LOC122063074 isoform X2 [Macadamia integrifolia]|uniref:uncharacterized protein LOC122063074 isoform X2 n=1 Tax=Macadamia integrifolia TaxID=60698 RepID=UPI001C4EB692|nr:uncharacterized protein LOC122063074 isoform X2 [Macadamia integrifolia]